MDSFNDVLDAAKAYCREHTADATYQYYISGLKAVSFENSNTITLEIRNAFILSIVSLSSYKYRTFTLNQQS